MPRSDELEGGVKTESLLEWPIFIISPAVVRAWCYRIIVNSALDYLRRHRRHLYLEADRLESESDKYQDFDLHSAIMSLSTRNRTIILLRFVLWRLPSLRSSSQCTLSALRQPCA